MKKNGKWTSLRQEEGGIMSRKEWCWQTSLPGECCRRRAGNKRSGTLSKAYPAHVTNWFAYKSPRLKLLPGIHAILGEPLRACKASFSSSRHGFLSTPSTKQQFKLYIVVSVKAKLVFNLILHTLVILFNLVFLRTRWIALLKWSNHTEYYCLPYMVGWLWSSAW